MAAPTRRDSIKRLGHIKAGAPPHAAFQVEDQGRFSEAVSPPTRPRQLQRGNSTVSYDLSEALGLAREPASCAWPVGLPKRVWGSRQGSCIRTLMPSSRDTTGRGGANSWPGAETTLGAWGSPRGSRASSGRSEEGAMRRGPLQDHSNHLPGRPSENQGQRACSVPWSQVPTRLWGGFLSSPRYRLGSSEAPTGEITF